LVSFVDASLVAGIIERLLTRTGLGEVRGVAIIDGFVLAVRVIDEVLSGGESMIVAADSFGRLRRNGRTGRGRGTGPGMVSGSAVTAKT
jgi:hypothetical protein